MASWAEFVSESPELGRLAEERIDRVGLILLGTLRSNGYPRISPVEALVANGRLYLGMMWQSKKALDLLRDARCVVHSIVTDKTGNEGDLKIYGRALDVTAPEEREHYCEQLERRIGWRPEGEFHLFSIEITEVGYFRSNEGEHDVRTWRPRERADD